MVSRLALSACISLVWISTAFAQGAATFSGMLSDPSGAPIPGAVVTAVRSGTAESHRTTTAADGRYRLQLDAGSYLVRITDPSFAPAERRVRLAPAESVIWNPRLTLEPLASTVTVTADARPMPVEDATSPVDILTAADIGERHAVSLGPLLASLAGVSLVQLGPAGGITSLFLDGGNSNFTKVLVDGTPVNEPGGAVDFSNYTLENVEKIEVVHGAASALDGSDAMTGVIQIFTRRGATPVPEIRAFADGGNFSTWHAGAGLSGLAGRFDYSGAAASLDTLGQEPNNRLRDNTLSGNFGWRVSDADSIRLSLRSSASDAGEAGQTLILPADPNQHDALKNFAANLAWDFESGTRWRHHLAASESYLGQTFADLPFFVVRNEYNRAGFEEQSSYLLPSGAVTAGYAAEIENGFFGGTHARRNNQAGYFEARYQLTRRLGAVAGARAEANASFGTRVVPRAGVSYALRIGRDFWGPIRAYASYGLGIKEPSFLQSFSADPCFPGNLALRPERSRTVDAGVDAMVAEDRVRVDVNGFLNSFRDVVSFAPGPLGPNCPFGTGTYFNTDEARANGAGARWEARPAGWLMLAANYTYDDTRVLRAPNAFDPALGPGNRLFLRPLNAANFVASVSRWKMNWHVDAEYVGRRTDSDFLGLGLASVPSYFIVNLGSSYRLGAGVAAYATADNLLDRKYQIALGYPALRLAFRAGLEYTWGGK
ncbi:MAG TPA: TonB-dependent receptor [Candidatus Acidoferrales bacterium]|nr:TonB-dependent receptor [Candidatus Acidoferrales bacterium]